MRARLTGAAAPTVTDAATLQLVSALVADAVAEDLYPATVAGLDYTISAVLDADALALSLKCGGFDEKVPALFDALLRGVRRAADEVVEPRAFAAAKSARRHLTSRSSAAIFLVATARLRAICPA